MTKSDLITRLRGGGQTGAGLLVFPGKSVLDAPTRLHAEIIAKTLEAWLHDGEEIHYGVEIGHDDDWTWYFVTDRGLLDLQSKESRDLGVNTITTAYRFRPIESLVSISAEDRYAVPAGLSRAAARCQGYLSLRSE